MDKCLNRKGTDKRVEMQQVWKVFSYMWGQGNILWHTFFLNLKGTSLVPYQKDNLKSQWNLSKPPHSGIHCKVYSCWGGLTAKISWELWESKPSWAGEESLSVSGFPWNIQQRWAEHVDIQKMLQDTDLQYGTVYPNRCTFPSQLRKRDTAIKTLRK